MRQGSYRKGCRKTWGNRYNRQSFPSGGDREGPLKLPNFPALLPAMKEVLAHA
jgi:hypothetical protein